MNSALLIDCEGLRVQWFRAHERANRWEEEVHRLQREAASTVLDFEVRRKHWHRLATNADVPGWKAYAYRQSSVWQSLLKAASET